MVLKLGHFGKYVRNTLKVLKRGAGEGWRSVGPIWRERKTYFTESRRKRNPTYTKTKDG
jgi:hypothetical protein